MEELQLSRLASPWIQIDHYGGVPLFMPIHLRYMQRSHFESHGGFYGLVSYLFLGLSLNQNLVHSLSHCLNRAYLVRSLEVCILKDYLSPRVEQLFHAGFAFQLSMYPGPEYALLTTHRVFDDKLDQEFWITIEKRKVWFFHRYRSLIHEYHIEKVRHLEQWLHAVDACLVTRGVANRLTKSIARSTNLVQMSHSSPDLWFRAGPRTQGNLSRIQLRLTVFNYRVTGVIILLKENLPLVELEVKKPHYDSSLWMGTLKRPQRQLATDKFEFELGDWFPEIEKILIALSGKLPARKSLPSRDFSPKRKLVKLDQI